MAFEYLNPVTAIWLESGLRYLLQPEGSAPKVATPVRSRPAACVAKEAARSTTASVISPQVNRNVDWHPFPVEDWPDPWRELFARTKRGRIAWTYAKLGCDLLAAAKPQTAEEEAQARVARSHALRRILGGLGHPAGTHTFWPAQLDVDGVPEIEIFWSGLRALGCRGVIFLDPDYAGLLCQGGQMRPYTQAKFRSQFIWPLPAIESLADTDYPRIIPYLRRALKPFAGAA